MSQASSSGPTSQKPISSGRHVPGTTGQPRHTALTAASNVVIELLDGGLLLRFSGR
jgi:hypothetical protein